MKIINRVYGSTHSSSQHPNLVPNRLVLVAAAALIIITAGLIALRSGAFRKFRRSTTPTPTFDTPPSTSTSTPALDTPPSTPTPMLTQPTPEDREAMKEYYENNVKFSIPIKRPNPHTPITTLDLATFTQAPPRERIDQMIIEERHKRAVKHNSEICLITQLPSETLEIIFGNMSSLEELANLSLTCRAFYGPARAKQIIRIKQVIEKTIDLAIFFDEQIRQLTGGASSLIEMLPLPVSSNSYVPFKFDLLKWRSMIQNLGTSNLTTNPQKLLEECRMDLVEALAEYNISEQFIPKEGSQSSSSTPQRFIHSLVLSPQSDDYQKSILEEAKSSLKGRLIIFGNVYYQTDLPKHTIFLKKEDSDSFGPYIQVYLSNFEDADWYNHPLQDKYPRYYTQNSNNSTWFHVDLFLKTNQDDRLILPPENGREQVIFRCNSRSDRLENDLTEHILYSVEQYESLYQTDEEREIFARKMTARTIALEKSIDSRGQAFYMPLLDKYRKYFVEKVESDRQRKTRLEELKKERTEAEERSRLSNEQHLNDIAAHNEKYPSNPIPLNR